MAEFPDEELRRLRAEVQYLRSLQASEAPPVLRAPPDSGRFFSDAHSPLHALLLLADTALPLGAFAYSAGLESYLAHHHQQNRNWQQQQGQTVGDKHPPADAKHPSGVKHDPSPQAKLPPTKSELLHSFLHQSLSTCARAALPFVFASYDDPARLYELDDMYDATVSCLVARRQSVETGRALLGAWMRGLGLVNTSTSQQSQSHSEDVHSILQAMDTTLRSSSQKQTEDSDPPLHHGHVAPLWGAVGRAAGVARHDAGYVFLLNHVRGLLSAAVRAGVLGPFKQLAMLADIEIRNWIEEGVKQAEQLISTKGVQAAGQVVPLNDIWGGRHEVLYSRVFNS